MQRKNKSKKEDSSNLTVEFLHTGSHLLNLAASQKAKEGGWGRGRIINLVGDGSSGKTLLALEACAQAFYTIKDKDSQLFQKPDKVTIVYNNKEGVMDFPLDKMYGKEFTRGVEWVQSETIEQCGRDVQRRVAALKKKEFLLYVADSLDSFDSQAGKARVEKSVRTDAQIDGTYGMEKAKYLSNNFFPHLCSSMVGKDTTIILISQVRDNINAGLFGNKYRRVGGKALDFYTHQVCWLAVIKKLTKEVKKKKRPYGVTVRAQFRRNKLATPFRDADFDILFDYGIDDIGSMVNYMNYKKDTVSEWERKPNKLIRAVEKDWNNCERKIKPERRRRFPE